MRKNQNGFTLVEIIVSLLIASIGMLIATSIILNSMGYFSKTTVSDHDKQALDGINAYVADELRYASEVRIDVTKPDDTEWNWIYWKDARLYRNKDQNTSNDYAVYNDNFYNKRLLTFLVRGFDSYRLDLKFSFKDTKGDVVYKTSNTLELLNLKVKKTQDEKFNPFSNVSTEIDLSGTQSNYKIYYKKGTLAPVPPEDTELSGDGTVADEIFCKDSKVTDIGSAGNNKGDYIQNQTYNKGDFVYFNGAWYRALIGPLTYAPGTTWEWKKIEKDYDSVSNFSNYAYGDIIIYENEYWQVISLNGSIGQKPSKDAFAVWSGGHSTVEQAKKATGITPSYAKCQIEATYAGLVANKDDNQTNVPAYETGGQFGQYIFRTYKGAIWYKLFNGYGNIGPGEVSKDGYVWQKIQIDWDEKSAYLSWDPNFSRADIIRFSDNGRYYMATAEIRDGRKPAKLQNGAWVVNSGWKEVTYTGNGNWQ